MNETRQETLQEFLDRVWEIHADLGPEMLMPTIIAQDPKGALHVFKTPWRNNHEKICALAMVTIEMLAAGCSRYVFVHEVWGASYASKDEVETRGTPSQRPDRIELLMAVAVDRYMDDRLAYAAEIENLPRNKRRLKERRTVSGSGRLYDLFGEGQATHSRATH